MDCEKLHRLRRCCDRCDWYGPRAVASWVGCASWAGWVGCASWAGWAAAPAGLARLPGLAALAALAELAGQQNDARTLATAIFWRGCFEIPSYSLILATCLDFAKKAVLSWGSREEAEAPWELLITWCFNWKYVQKWPQEVPR